MSAIKTPSPAEIRARYQSAHPEWHFFDRSTMRFFGDVMSNFRTRRLSDGRVLMYRARKLHPYMPAGSGYIFDETTCDLSVAKDSDK